VSARKSKNVVTIKIGRVAAERLKAILQADFCSVAGFIPPARRVIEHVLKQIDAQTQPPEPGTESP
jgi:hypothetical protein